MDEPLPGFDHAPPTPQLPFANWIVPRSSRVQMGDVIVWGEHAHQLLSPLPPGDDGFTAVVEQGQIWMERAQLAQWIADIEVWLGHRLTAGRPWPEPPS